MPKAKLIPISEYYNGIGEKDECARCDQYACEHFVRIGKSGVLGYVSDKGCKNFAAKTCSGFRF